MFQIDGHPRLKDFVLPLAVTLALTACAPSTAPPPPIVAPPVESRAGMEVLSQAQIVQYAMAQQFTEQAKIAGSAQAAARELKPVDPRYYFPEGYTDNLPNQGKGLLAIRMSNGNIYYFVERSEALRIPNLTSSLEKATQGDIAPLAQALSPVTQAVRVTIFTAGSHTADPLQLGDAAAYVQTLDEISALSPAARQTTLKMPDLGIVGNGKIATVIPVTSEPGVSLVAERIPGTPVEAVWKMTGRPMTDAQIAQLAELAAAAAKNQVSTLPAQRVFLDAAKNDGILVTTNGEVALNPANLKVVSGAPAEVMAGGGLLTAQDLIPQRLMLTLARLLAKLPKGTLPASLSSTSTPLNANQIFRALPKYLGPASAGANAFLILEQALRPAIYAAKIPISADLTLLERERLGLALAGLSGNETLCLFIQGQTKIPLTSIPTDKLMPIEVLASWQNKGETDRSFAKCDPLRLMVKKGQNGQFSFQFNGDWQSARDTDWLVRVWKNDKIVKTVTNANELVSIQLPNTSNKNDDLYFEYTDGTQIHVSQDANDMVIDFMLRETKS